MQIAEVVLYFAVGQFAVDQVAEVVVVIAAAVVVEAGDAVAVGGTDEVAVQVVLVNGFLNLVVVAGEGMD